MEAVLTSPLIYYASRIVGLVSLIFLVLKLSSAANFGLGLICSLCVLETSADKLQIH